MIRDLTELDVRLITELSRGRSTGQIASGLRVQPAAVSNRLARIAELLGFQYRGAAHLVAEAYRRGVLTDCACHAGSTTPAHRAPRGEVAS